MQVKAKSRWRFDPDDLSVPAAIVIALGLLLTCGLLLVSGMAAKWAGLILSTLALFAYFIHDSRNYLQNPRFWILTGSLLALHLLAWIALLSHVERWGLLWFNIMVLELPVFWSLRGWPGLLD